MWGLISLPFCLFAAKDSYDSRFLALGFLRFFLFLFLLRWTLVSLTFCRFGEVLEQGRPARGLNLVSVGHGLRHE